MLRYKVEFQGEGTPEELIQQLQGVIEGIEEHKETATLDGLNCDEEDGYPFTYIIQSI
jgi:hypothetical protein